MSRRAKKAVAIAVASMTAGGAWLACTQPLPAGPATAIAPAAISASSASAALAPAPSSSAAPSSSIVAASADDAAPRTPPPVFRFEAEVPAGTYPKMFRLPSGVAVFESNEKAWQVRVAHGRGALAPVDALRRTPESKIADEELFVGETADKELWLSLLDTTDMPRLEFMTLRVRDGRVDHDTSGWYREVASLTTGEVITLPSSENPAYLAEQTPQHFVRARGKSKTPLVAIPPDLRLYDVEILPNGEIHAMGALQADGAMPLFGFVATPGSAPRILALPSEVGFEQPRLVRGSPTFLAVAEGKDLWLFERDGHVVGMTTPVSFTAATTAPNGEVWFDEGTTAHGPQLRRGRIDTATGTMHAVSTVPVPHGAALATAGAPTCRDLGHIESIAPLPDGNIWLLISCAGGAEVILRALPP